MVGVDADAVGRVGLGTGGPGVTAPRQAIALQHEVGSQVSDDTGEPHIFDDVADQMGASFIVQGDAPQARRQHVGAKLVAIAFEHQYPTAGPAAAIAREPRLFDRLSPERRQRHACRHVAGDLQARLGLRVDGSLPVGYVVLEHLVVLPPGEADPEGNAGEFIAGDDGIARVLQEDAAERGGRASRERLDPVVEHLDASRQHHDVAIDGNGVLRPCQHVPGDHDIQRRVGRRQLGDDARRE